MVARSLPADGDGREGRQADFLRNLLGRAVVVANVHDGTMPDGNRSEQSEFAFDPIANRDHSRTDGEMGDRGFEPRTSALSERRSNRLS